MSNHPLVSVNITTYNRCSLLKRAIDSVLKQNYSNFELIIIDDCSLDETEKVVAEYIKNDQRIKYIKHDTNRGLAVARNTGIKNSSGKYLATMDDDDEWIVRDKLLKQVYLLENEGFDFVYSNVTVVRPDEIFNYNIKRPANLKKHMLVKNGIIYTSTVLFKSEILIEIGGYDESLKKGIDSDVYRRLLFFKDAKSFLMDEHMIKYYEDSPNRITNIKQDGLINSILAVKICLKKFKSEFILYPNEYQHRIKEIMKLYFYLLKITKNPYYLLKSVLFSFYFLKKY